MPPLPALRGDSLLCYTRGGGPPFASSSATNFVSRSASDKDAECDLC